MSFSISCRPSIQFRFLAVSGNRHQNVTQCFSTGTHRRAVTSAVTAPPAKGSKTPESRSSIRTLKRSTGLERLSTPQIIRNVILGAVFTFPVLSRPSFSTLRTIANSDSRFLNPDVNPVLRMLLRPLLYSQFCAGSDRLEILRTRESIKRMGYSGIILCYGKEVPVSPPASLKSPDEALIKQTKEITHWKDGNLATLDMVDSGDWLGIKFSGAGTLVTQALASNRPPPEEFTAAISTICEKAAAQGCRIWIDAEQHVLQGAIDDWTIALMRKYNKSGRTLVYNTLQAYLKSSRAKLRHQLALSREEGWALAIKVVRGAYISKDPRELIHDTKQDTDASYDSIVHDLLSGQNLGFTHSEHPENVQLFIAGHNPHSIEKAMALIQTLHADGKLRVLPDFGQLQGMGDVLGCRFLQQCEALDAEREASSDDVVIPKLYKCLTWGSVQECMQYLFRRAVENSGGTDRMRDGLLANMQELKRRMVSLERRA